MGRLRLAAATLLLAAAIVPGPAPAARWHTVARTFVAWAPAGLPWKTEKALDEMYGVDATTVVAGVMWMTRATAPRGMVVSDPPSGYAYPLEVAFVTPREFRDYVPDQDRRAVGSLDSSRALIPPGESKLRDDEPRLRVRVDGETRVVSMTKSNRATLGYELLMAAPAPKSFRRLRFVLIEAGPGVTRLDIRRRIARLLPASTPLRLRAEGEVPYLRYADSVHPLFVFKRRFGEFAARPVEHGTFIIDPRWVGANIVTATVPILGEVRCHRRLLGPLRGALEDVRDEGLASEIDPDEYAGCYSPRFVATAPGTRLSRHAWGIALDVNARSNPFGAEPTLDRRVVVIFERWGFLWGGRWPLPDGMHFEWTTEPTPS